MNRRRGAVPPLGMREVAYPGCGRVLAVSTPYSAGFVRDIKLLVPARYRIWLGSQRLWIVQLGWWSVAERLLVKWFGHAPVNPEVAPWYQVSPSTPEWPGHPLPGAARRPRQTASAPPPPATAGAPAVPAAFATLGLLPGVDPEVAKAAYRLLARKHHPDANGSTEAMQRINAAWDKVRSELDRRST